MDLRESLSRQDPSGFNVRRPEDKFDPSEDRLGIELRGRVHQRVLDMLDLNATENMTEVDLKAYLRRSVERVVSDAQLIIGTDDLARLVNDIQNEITGFGPLEVLLKDPTVSDILVNSAKSVFVERKGRLEKTRVRFDSDEHLIKIIEKI